jgi:uncharacterized membrane protein YoaK (UPF0700 family)
MATGLGFAAALSCLAGMTDAIGFLVAGDFVSFMSGNTTRLAVAVGEGFGAQAAHLAFLVIVFVLGNSAGVVFVHLTHRRHALIVGLVAAVLGLAGLLHALDQALVATLAVVFAMGLVNVAVERVDGHALGVTYVTGALSRFGRGLGRWLVGAPSGRFWIEIVPWTGMLVGAVLGALAVGLLGPSAIFVAAAFAAALAVISGLIPQRWRKHYFG